MEAAWLVVKRGEEEEEQASGSGGASAFQNANQRHACNHHAEFAWFQK